MQKYDVIIYEYDKQYFIIQRSKQDKRQDECPSENVALAAKLPENVNLAKLGEKVLDAINDYGRIDPTYPPWELKKLRKQLCSWLDAKSYSSVLKNSRMVIAQKNFDNNKIEIIPFDNFNINAWETLLVDDIIYLPIDSDAKSIGTAVNIGFSIATFHPERKKKG